MFLKCHDDLPPPPPPLKCVSGDSEQLLFISTILTVCYKPMFCLKERLSKMTTEVVITHFKNIGCIVIKQVLLLDRSANNPNSWSSNVRNILSCSGQLGEWENLFAVNLKVLKSKLMEDYCLA